MSTQLIELKSTTSTSMMGMRRSAVPVRAAIESALAKGEKVTLDFTDVEATQSFIDELVGVLVVKNGTAILSQLFFKGCSPALKGIVSFVVADRARDFKKSAH